MPTGFLAVWSEEDRDGPFISDRRLVARTVSPDGALGPVARIAALENGSSEDLDVAVDAAGMGVAVWQDLDRGDEILRAASIDTSTGAVSTAVDVDPSAQFASRHCWRLPPGRFLIAWPSGPVRARVLTLCGNAIPEPGEACDDGNRRDGDCCAAACRLEPMPGTCWRLAGSIIARLSATITQAGQTYACAARCRGASEATLILLDDGTYRWPQGSVACTSGETRTLPDEVGRRRGRGARARLSPANLAEIRSATRACTGAMLGGQQTTLRLGGDTLRGTQSSHLRRAGHPSIRVQAMTRFAGVPLGSGTRPAPPALPQTIPSCAGELTFRCRPR